MTDPYRLDAVSDGLQATVVIATRDRASFLCDCLASLSRQTAAGRYEVVVADNGSTDDTAAIVAQFDRLGVRSVFVETANRAKARNAGIAAARAPLLIFCDDDTIAPERFVEAHLRAHRRRPRSVAAGPIVNVSDASIRAAPGLQHYSRAFFCTCNASVPKVDLDAVGGFDERYDLYGWEDTDLGIRLRRRGLRRVWSWDAAIYHIKPAAALSLDRRLSLAREKGMMAARFVRKSSSWAAKLATGAYGANFVRARLLGAKPVRDMYARIASSDRLAGTPIGAWARDSIVDAEYVDTLRAALSGNGGVGSVTP